VLRKSLSVVLGLLTFLFGGELLFRALPVSTATSTDYYVDRNFLTYPSNHRWITATGWDLRNVQHLRANNIGFVSPRDAVPDRRAVALIGDSYVEGSMLDARDRLDQQLERRLGGMRPVYAMGSPGTSLLDYAERIRFADERLDIRDFVLLIERADVRQSVCGSGMTEAPCLDQQTFALRFERRAEASQAKKILRHSALAQYVFSQLKADGGRLAEQARLQFSPATTKKSDPGANQPSRPAAGACMKTVDAVTGMFLERAVPHVRGRMILLVDADRNAIRHGLAHDDPCRQRFIELMRNAGAIVIDTDSLIRTHYAASALSVDVGPYDAHLNRLGLQLFAQAAAAALQQPASR